MVAELIQGSFLIGASLYVILSVVREVLLDLYEREMEERDGDQY